MPSYLDLVFSGAIALTLWLNAAAAEPGPAVESGRYQQGKAVYNFYCYQCHAYAGDARTLASTFLDPKPRNFTQADPEQLNRERMIDALTHGRPGTAMMSFTAVLDADAIQAVVEFVRREFMQGERPALIYHTSENGWEDHQRYAAAFPFASGELPLDTPWEALTEDQKQGKRLFMQACVSCHDRSRVRDEGAIWELRPLSYPRDHYDHTRPDSVSGASPYAVHDKPPSTEGLSPAQLRGAGLFQRHCAFCHGADGTARNWIGSFLEPHPRDLTTDDIRNRDPGLLKAVIKAGLPDTSMPAWKGVLNDTQIEEIIAYLQRDAAGTAVKPGTAVSPPSVEASSTELQWQRTGARR